MPELPPLRIKVRVDDDDLTRAQAHVREFGEASERDLQKASQALVQFGERGEVTSLKIKSSTATSSEDMGKLERQARQLAEGMEVDLRKGTQAVVRLGEDGEASLQSLTRATQPAQAAVQEVSGTLAGMGPVGIAVAAILGSLAAQFAVIVTPTIAFAVGAAAAATSMVGLVGASALLAGSVVLLAERTDVGKRALEELGGRVQSLGDSLADSVMPLLPGVIDLLDRLASRAALTANTIVAEFSSRVPRALEVLSGFAAVLFDGFDKLIPVAGRFFDQLAARAPGFEDLFSKALDGAVAAVDGLLTNLLRLSDWFEQRLDLLGPTAKANFDSLGLSLQLLGNVLGIVVDQLAQVDLAWLAFFGVIRDILGPALDEFEQHPLVAALAIRILATDVAALGGAILAPILVLTTLGVAIYELVGLVLRLVDGIGHVVTAMRRFGEEREHLTGGMQVLAFQAWGVVAVFDRIGGALGILGSNQEHAARTGEGLAASDRSLAAASDAVTKSFQRQNEEIQKNLDLANADISSDLALKESQLAVQRAIEGVDKATSAASDASRVYGANSQQAHDANLALQEATLAAERAMIAESLAAVDLAKKHSELSGQTLSARDAADLQIGSLRTLEASLGPNSPVRAAIDGYIAELDRIPRTVNTTVTTTIVSRLGAEAPGFRQSGGPVLPHRAYVVGEGGPELLLMGATAGTVVPHSQLAAESGSVEVSNLSTRRIERLLVAQNQLLERALARPASAKFSNAAYGS